MYNLAAFAKVMKVMNHTGLWDADFTLYLLTATYCFHRLEHGLKIHDFRPIWFCQIVKVLVTWVKISSTILLLYCNNLRLQLLHNKCFWLLYGIMAQFELAKYKFLN